MFWLAALSVGLSAAGAASQASAQRRSSAYSRDVALNNQKIAQDNARDVELRGRLSVYDQRRAVARQLGDIRVATAGAGLEVDVAGTTPQDMVQSMVEAGELDVLRLRNNIDREVRRALIQGAEFEAQAGQFELQRQSYNPFRSALTAGVGSAVNNHDILFES